MIIDACENCGKTYIKTKRHMKYCSKKCRKQVQRKREKAANTFIYSEWDVLEPKPEKQKTKCSSCVWGCTGICIMPSCIKAGVI